MKIIITVFRKDEYDEKPFEVAEARDFVDAEGKLAIIGRHYETTLKEEANIIPEDDHEDGATGLQPMFPADEVQESTSDSANGNADKGNEG